VLVAVEVWFGFVGTGLRLPVKGSNLRVDIGRDLDPRQCARERHWVDHVRRDLASASESSITSVEAGSS